MRAKRQIMSLLLALLLVWQGFSFANAETGTSVVTAGNGAGTEPSPATGSTISGAGTASSSTISGTGTASKKGKAIENALFDVKLLVDKKPVEDIHSFANYQSMQFAAKINVKGLDIEEGDYISIQLPHELRSSDLTFDLKTPDQKKLLAKGEYNQATKEMLITFTKEAKDSNVTNGEVFFNTEIDTELIKESIPAAQLELKINGKTVINQNLEYLVVKENSKSFYKDRSRKLIKLKDKEGNTHYLIHYTVTLDTRNIQKVPGATSYENIVFTDTLQSNALSYFDVKNHFTKLNLNQADIDRYAPVLRKGIWRTGDWVKVPGKTDKIWKNASDDSDENRGPNWSLRNRQNPDDFAPAVTDSPKYSDGGRSFTYSLGTLAPYDGYELSYYVEINEAFKNGDEFYNQAKLTGKGIVSAERRRDFEVSEAGGFLEGQNFSIQIEKVGDDGKALQGAEFTLAKPNGNYTKTIETDEFGIAKFENVLKADYVLTEVKAPEGYDLDSTPLHIYKENFEKSIASGSTITLTIKNKKKGVEKKSTSFSVEKKWVLDSDPNLATNKPDKVTVFVLKNGHKDKTVELSQENGWKASFSNLPKEDANGPIVYTVSEETIAGFKTAISGTDENGFTITNYKGENVVIPVTKKWKGSGAHPDQLNVQLFANGAKVDSVTLNAGNNWQYNFEKPKYDANRTEIRYTVTEENVSGYTLSNEDNPATGYVNVFVNTKNDVPPTSPNGGGNGGGGNGGGGNPPKPSPNTPGTPTEPTPGNVLGKNRDPESNPETVAAVLSVDKTVPSVLGAGRGFVKTEDASRMPIYLLFFALSACGLTATVLYDRKRSKR